MKKIPNLDVMDQQSYTPENTSIPRNSQYEIAEKKKKRRKERITMIIDFDLKYPIERNIIQKYLIRIKNIEIFEN